MSMVRERHPRGGVRRLVDSNRTLASAGTGEPLRWLTGAGTPVNSWPQGHAGPSSEGSGQTGNGERGSRTLEHSACCSTVRCSGVAQTRFVHGSGSRLLASATADFTRKGCARVVWKGNLIDASAPVTGNGTGHSAAGFGPHEWSDFGGNPGEFGAGLLDLARASTHWPLETAGRVPICGQSTTPSFVPAMHRAPSLGRGRRSGRQGSESGFALASSELAGPLGAAIPAPSAANVLAWMKGSGPDNRSICTRSFLGTPRGVRSSVWR